MNKSTLELANQAVATINLKGSLLLFSTHYFIPYFDRELHCSLYSRRIKIGATQDQSSYSYHIRMTHGKSHCDVCSVREAQKHCICDPMRFHEIVQVTGEFLYGKRSLASWGSPMSFGIHGDHTISASKIVDLVFEIRAVPAISVQEYKWFANPFFLIVQLNVHFILTDFDSTLLRQQRRADDARAVAERTELNARVAHGIA